MGHPNLSENLNRLKYESEGRAFLENLQKVDKEFKKSGRQSLCILDVGAGTGYWSEFVGRVFSQKGYRIRLAALDISLDALSAIRQRNPDAETIQGDLRTIDPNRYSHAHDLVISCYCLHHLPHVEDFLNALRFVSRSVNSGGFLMLMDPVLTLPFSQFDVLDFASFRGNGIPRHLYLLEDVLFKEGFRRIGIKPAVSFILNGNIEGRDRLTYELASGIWRILCRSIYKSEGFVRLISKPLGAVDEILKRLDLAFSSSVCVYRRGSV